MLKSDLPFLIAFLVIVLAVSFSIGTFSEDAPECPPPETVSGDPVSR